MVWRWMVAAVAGGCTGSTGAGGRRRPAFGALCRCWADAEQTGCSASNIELAVRFRCVEELEASAMHAGCTTSAGRRAGEQMLHDGGSGLSCAARPMRVRVSPAPVHCGDAHGALQTLCALVAHR